MDAPFSSEELDRLIKLVNGPPPSTPSREQVARQATAYAEGLARLSSLLPVDRRCPALIDALEQQDPTPLLVALARAGGHKTIETSIPASEWAKTLEIVNPRILNEDRARILARALQWETASAVREAYDRGVTEHLCVPPVSVTQGTRVEKSPPRWLSRGAMYAGVLILAIALTSAVIAWVSGTTVNVSISYNVGEIIAGLLAGGGIAAAGAAYAVQTLAQRRQSES